MSKPLYELTALYARLLESDEEVIDEATGEVSHPFEAALAELSDAIDIKVDGCARVLRQLSADAVMLKAEEERLYKRRKSAENRVERLKEYLRENLATANKDRVQTTLFLVTLGKPGTKPEVFDESLIPDELRAEPKRPAPDMKAIGAMLHAGKEVAGAHLVPSKRTLTIR